jgi:hypothetical protein
LVRSIEKIGISEIGIAILFRFPANRDRRKSATRNQTGRQTLPGLWLMTG